MNKTEKVVTWVFTGIATVGSIFSLYIHYKDIAFKQPLDKHASISQSFKDQIDSIEKRGDKVEADKIRKEYEKFEESWRNTEIVSSLIKWLSTDDLTKIDDKTKQAIANSLQYIDDKYADAFINPRLLGNAWTAIGNYDKALKSYLKAAQIVSKNQETYLSNKNSIIQKYTKATDEEKRQMLLEESQMIAKLESISRTEGYQ